MGQFMKAILFLVIFCFISKSFGENEIEPKIGSWLDGIETQFVDTALFVNFSAFYLPYRDPYSAVTAKLQSLPVSQLDEAISRYGSSIPGGISPFYSRSKLFGRPQSILFQYSDYSFKSTCASCPERASFHFGSLVISYPRDANGHSNYVSLDLDKIEMKHFSQYPFLRELLELQAIMLDYRNPKSYVFQTERSIWHGLQAVLDFVETEKPQLSEYTRKALAQMASQTPDVRIRSALNGDILRESGSIDRPLYEQYPYESVTGKRVLIRAVLDSHFSSGRTQIAAQNVIADYQARKARADYSNRVFRNPNSWSPQNLGPVPKWTRAYPWWENMRQWATPNKLSGNAQSCREFFND